MAKVSVCVSAHRRLAWSYDITVLITCEWASGSDFSQCALAFKKLFKQKRTSYYPSLIVQFVGTVPLQTLQIESGEKAPVNHSRTEVLQFNNNYNNFLAIDFCVFQIFLYTMKW